MTTAAWQPTTMRALVERYDIFLLDAYGVLVNQGGALPGAAAFLQHLVASGRDYLLLSNDASRSVDTSWKRYTGFGLPLDRNRILTSGMLLGDHFAREGLVGARCLVLGTEDSRAYVRDAGGVPVPASDESATVCVLADDDGYPFLETVGQVCTTLLRRLERGQHTHLVLPNPDLVFPRGDGSVGLTAGAGAAMIEAVLKLRAPSGSERFVPLGKPHRPIYEAAMKRLGHPDPARVLMVGDQPLTDIQGANAFGLDAVLVLTGIGRLTDLTSPAVSPRFVVDSVGI